MESPLPATTADRMLRLRKGTIKKAFDAGLLKGVSREGRGGMQIWVFPSDAEAWFRDGAKTTKE